MYVANWTPSSHSTLNLRKSFYKYKCIARAAIEIKLILIFFHKIM